MERATADQLTHFLSDMYSVEQQALAQLVSAPQSAGDPLIAAHYAQHYRETEEQSAMVHGCLEARGGSPSALKDVVMRLGGKGFLAFAQVQPETPGRLIVHSYSYEAMEWAGYQILLHLAHAAGDMETAKIAERIAAEERTMMGRLEGDFATAEHATHGGLGFDALQEHVVKHLGEVHAFEEQGIELLKKSEQIAGDPVLQELYADQELVMRHHLKLVEGHLEALGSSPSRWKDIALKLGGINWGLFFQSQKDTPGKLAAFVYAFLHLQIGGYCMLSLTAKRAADGTTADLCDDIVGEKRRQAEALADAFERAALA